MKIKHRGKEIELENIKKVNLLGEAIGLMLCSRKKARALLFDFEKSTKMKLHSFFVFFPFIAIWLDKENNILDFKKIKPFQINVGIEKSFYKIVEIPIKKEYFGILALLDGN